MADDDFQDALEAFNRGIDVRELRRMRAAGTLPPDPREARLARRLGISVDELRARREDPSRLSGIEAARFQRAIGQSPAPRAPASPRAAAPNMPPAQFPPNAFAEAESRNRAPRPNYYAGPGEDTEEAAAMNRVQSASGRGMPRTGPGEDSPEAVAQVRRMSVTPPTPPELTDFPPNPYAETPREVRSLLSRRAAEQDRLRNRSNARMTATQPEATPDELMNRYNRPTAIGEGGTPQPLAPAAGDKPFLDRVLGGIGLRRTNQTGMDPATEALMRDMYGSQYSNQYNMKKGGKVKKMAKGGVVKASSASRRGDGVASRGKTKGRMV